MIVITEQISQETFNELTDGLAMVKVVVDVEKEIFAAGCELHVDCAEKLAEEGSSWKNLWGANIYPKTGKIDFVSLINIRPAVGNREMEIKDQRIRKQIELIIKNLLPA